MKVITQFLIFSIFGFGCSSNVQSSSVKLEIAQEKSIDIKPKLYELDSIKLYKKVEEAKIYCQQNKLNTKYCILIDMEIHSGRERLFLWGFNQNKIVLSGLCSHGCGNLNWGADDSKLKPVFSNIPDSHLSSLGKYKIGKRGWSNWGIHINYKLHGLDITNSNAYQRIIVLHSWEAVQEEETYPKGTPEGWGCPAINNKIMNQIDNFLKKEKAPVLLWIYQ